jgi:3-hydroxybutyryl-CoA dehydrogenase
VLFDLALDYASATRLAVAAADTCSAAALGAGVGALQATGAKVSRLDDVAGLAVMRTVAMLANEAADAVVQGVARSPRRSISRCRRASAIRAGRSLGPMHSALASFGIRLANLALHYGEDRYGSRRWLRGVRRTGGKLGG